MRRTALSDYLSAPRGKWTSGEGWLHFCAGEPRLIGAVIWGHLDEVTIEVLLRCATSTIAGIAESHPVLVDGTRVTSFEPAIFTMVSNYVSLHADALRRVSQLVAVRPPGAGGALAEGFFRVVPAPYPVRVVSSRGDALRMLGCDAHHSRLEDIEALAGAFMATSRLLGGLHQSIERHLAHPDLATTAKELRLSMRSMQRHLKVQGTSFQREVAIVRVRVAQRLMVDRNRSLAEVAMASGFASTARFSETFRKVLGRTPKQWRETCC